MNSSRLSYKKSAKEYWQNRDITGIFAGFQVVSMRFFHDLRPCLFVTIVLIFIDNRSCLLIS
jgi:hypothetical protein